MIYLIAVFGLVFGSFLNVCIYRIPLKESIVINPSHCASCKGKLKWYDLIPLFSYFILKGRCRFCGEKISIRYPLVETLNAILWIFIYLKFSLTVNSIIYMIFCSALIVIFFVDYKHLIIPDELLIFLLIFVVLFNIINLNKYTLLSSALGFFVISVPLFVISALTKGGIGGGDIKLMAVCGAFLGYKLIVVAFFLGVLSAGIISIFLISANIKKRGDLIPFGPFLTMGIILSIFVGNSLIEWYLQFFLI